MFSFACFYLELLDYHSTSLHQVPNTNKTANSHEHFDSTRGESFSVGGACRRHPTRTNRGAAVFAMLKTRCSTAKENPRESTIDVMTCFSFSQLAGSLIAEWETRREMKFLQEMSTAEQSRRTRAGKPFVEANNKTN